jgi:hypothetical protein
MKWPLCLTRKKIKIKLNDSHCRFSVRNFIEILAVSEMKQLNRQLRQPFNPLWARNYKKNICYIFTSPSLEFVPIFRAFLLSLKEENMACTTTIWCEVRAECIGRNYFSVSTSTYPSLCKIFWNNRRLSRNKKKETSTLFRHIGQTLSDSIEF